MTSTPMNAHSQNRLYELDWLRTAAIVLVVWFHAGMFFNSWDWHVKSSHVVPGLEPLMVWMHSWRMPLLLFISGIGASFLLRRRSLLGFAWERHKRLLLPLVIGMFLIVPPQIFVEKIAQYDSYLSFYATVFELESYPAGNFSWHHLWFIAYLFLFNLAALPLFAVVRSPRSAGALRLVGAALSQPGALALGAVALYISEILLRPYFPHNTHALLDDWAGFSMSFMYFLFGYLAMSLPGVWDAIKRDRWIYAFLALASAVAMELRFFGKLGGVDLPYFWNALSICVGWFTILALVGWAQTCLRRRSERLARWNEASYPVYILHQTLIVVASYPISRWGLSWQAEFALLFAIGLGGSFALYHFAIQRVDALRVAFGLKLKPRPATTSASYARTIPEAGVALAGPKP